MKFLTVKKLINRIERHRGKCPYWELAHPCFDCHYGILSDIEYEIGVRDHPLHYNLIKKNKGK